jgi:hypothetical protein
MSLNGTFAGLFQQSRHFSTSKTEKNSIDQKAGPSFSVPVLAKILRNVNIWEPRGVIE